MTRARRFAVLLVALALAAAPCSALAQSGGAGDEQYQDPFANTRTTTTQGGGGSLSQVPPETSAASAPPVAQAGAGTTTRALPAELARTGGDVRRVALAGAVLLVGGLLLRRRADGR